MLFATIFWWNRDVITNYIRDEIDNQLANAEGVKFKFDNLGVGLALGPSVIISGIVVQDRSGCQLAEAEKIQIGFSFSSLISNNFQPEWIRLDSLQISPWNENGELSFASKGCQQQKVSTESIPPVGTPPKPVKIIPNYSKTKIHLSNAEVKYSNNGNLEVYKIIDASSVISVVNQNLIIELENLETSFQDTPISFHADSINFDLVDQELDFQNIILQLREDQLSFSGSINPDSLTYRLNLITERLHINSLQALIDYYLPDPPIGFQGIVTTNLNLTQVKDKPLKVNGEVKLEDFSFKWKSFHLQKIKETGLIFEDPPVGSLFSAVLSGSDFNIDFAENRIQGLDLISSKLELQNIDATPILKAKLQANIKNVASYGQQCQGAMLSGEYLINFFAKDPDLLISSNDASLGCKDYRYPAIALGLKAVQFSSLDIKGINRFKGDFSANSFEISNNKSKYQSGRVKGNADLRLQQDQWSLTGQSKVDDFSYRDKNWSVTKVNGEIRNFNLQSNKDLKISGEIDANNLQFSSPNLSVKSIKRANVPLTLFFPQSQSAQVTGRVTLNNIVSQIQANDFHWQSGLVDFEIGGRSSKYLGTNLKLLSTPDPLTIDFDLLDKDNRFSFNRILITPPQGTLGFKGEIDLNQGKDFQSEISAQNFPLKTLNHFIPMFLPNSKSSLSGELAKLEAKIKGQTYDFAGTLSGDGTLDLTTPFTKRRNIADRILQITSNLSPLTILKDLTGQTKRHSAVIKTGAKFKIAKGEVVFSEFKSKFPEFNFEGDGTLSFDGQVNAKAQAIFLSEHLKIFRFGLTQLQTLMNYGRLTIPLKINGIISDPAISLDLVRLPSAIPGLSLVGGVANFAVNAGKKSLDFISSPFRSRPKEKSKDLESQ